MDSHEYDDRIFVVRIADRLNKGNDYLRFALSIIFWAHQHEGAEGAHMWCIDIIVYIIAILVVND